MKPASLALGFALLGLCGAAASIVCIIGPLGYIGAALACLLAAASYIDARHFLLLDIFTLPLILAGLGLAYFGMGPSMLNAGLGAALGYAGLWAISALYKRLRGHEGLGMGDAKLVAGAGAWCGGLALPFVLLIGSLSALVFVGLLALSGRKIDGAFKLPFGPFLSLGFFVTWLLGAMGSSLLAS